MKYVNRMPCAACGSIRVRCLITGLTDDDQQLRLRRCEDCRNQVTTIEVPVAGYSLYQLDSGRKLANRMRMREMRGYHGGLGGRRPVATPRVRVKVTVEPRERSVAA